MRLDDNIEDRVLMAIATLIQGIIVLSLPWLAIELLDFYIRNHGSNKIVQIPLIQFYSNRVANNLSVSRGTLWIKLETTAFNALPDKFLHKIIGTKNFSNLSYGREEVLPCSRQTRIMKSNRSKFLSRLYDVGVIFAFFAFFASLTIIVWGAFGLIGEMMELMQTQKDDVQVKSVEEQAIELAQEYSIQRRQLSYDQATIPIGGEITQNQQSNTSTWTPNLKPLLPGLTLPWSHLLPLIVALIVTQVLHEAGHAICGTLYDLAPLRMGIMFLYPAIPGAFVLLPSAASSIGSATDDQEEDENTTWQELEGGLTDEEEVEHTSLREKMHIISAGVWHNALTAMILSIFLLIPVGNFIHNICFYDTGALRVQKVQSSSPLAMHISAGAIITHLDDLELTASDLRNAKERSLLWDEYLSYQPNDKTTQIADRGWCVAPHTWKSSSTVCCQKYLDGQAQNAIEDKDTSIQGSKLCFVNNDRTQGRCYDPTFLVEGKAERCMASCPFTDANGYPAESICVRPDNREELLRITVQEQGIGKKQEKVVLFQGNRYAVHIALKVSPYAFRLWSGLRLPELIFKLLSMIFNYSLTLSVAMALFNMLPLPTLDGDVFLTMLFAYWFSPIGAALDENGLENQTKAEDEVPGTNVSDEIALQSQARDTRHGSLNESTRNRANGGGNGVSSKQEEEMEEYKRSFRRKRYVSSGKPKFSVLPKTISQIHKRINWVTMILSIFVFGGSIVMHVIKMDG